MRIHQDELCKIELDDLDSFSCRVVGTSKYQDDLQRMYDETHIRGVLVVPNPDHPVDPNAVEIYVLELEDDHGFYYDCTLVGFLPADVAKISRHEMAKLPKGKAGFYCHGLLKKNPKVKKSLVGIRLNLPLAT